MTAYLPGDTVLLQYLKLRKSKPYPGETIHLGNVMGEVLPREGRGPMDATGRYLVNITPGEDCLHRRYVVLAHESEMEMVRTAGGPALTVAGLVGEGK